MASTPKRRAWLARIKNELGGWTALLERRAGGESWGTIAKDVGCSYSFIYTMMKSAAKESEKFAEALAIANKVYAETLAERGLERLENAELNRDAINKATQVAGYMRWLATIYDREKYGEPKEKAAQPLSIGELHISALLQAPARALLKSAPIDAVVEETK